MILQYDFHKYLNQRAVLRDLSLEAGVEQEGAVVNAPIIEDRARFCLAYRDPRGGFLLQS